MKTPNAIFILAPDAYQLVYGPEELHQISRLVNLVSPPVTREYVSENTQLLREVDILFSGWSPPVLNQEFLKAAPRLKAVFYGAGAIGSIMTDEAWQRGITITSAVVGNSIPVAEYCLGVILFSLKHGWRFARECRNSHGYPPRPPVPGAYGSTIGLVSMGTVALELRRRLEMFDLRVIAYDPYMSAEAARAKNISLVTLDELFRRSDVVSLHTPLLEETHGMITGQHIALMKRGATLINTSRGAIIRQDEMEQVLRQRHDLTAVLDVVDPEPPTPDCGIFDLENVILTPHIAGSLDGECRRMGRMMVEELKRYLAGETLKWEITPEMAAHSSHRPVTRAPSSPLVMA